MFALTVKPGLELRPYELSHAPTVFARVDAERQYLREWLPWVDSTQSVADSEEFIRGSREKWATGAWDAGIWVDGAYAGGLGLHYLDTVNRKTEIGYWLSAACTGRGLMTECCRAVINELFRAGVNRIEIRCATENRRSRAIPEHLGFTLEGIAQEALWLHDRHVDVAVYALLAADYRRSSAA